MEEGESSKAISAIREADSDDDDDDDESVLGMTGAVVDPHADALSFSLSRGVDHDAESHDRFEHGLDRERMQLIEDTAAAVGASLAETFFHFFALTDQLTLHSLKQAVIEGQPASRLALLLYSVVFKHPVFDGFNSASASQPAASASSLTAHHNRTTSGDIFSSSSSSSGSGSNGNAFALDECYRPATVTHNHMNISSTTVAPMPRVLIPFAKQLLYYMGFFPEVSAAMEPLVEVSEWLRASVNAYAKQQIP
jgi:hypothetical protein